MSNISLALLRDFLQAADAFEFAHVQSDFPIYLYLILPFKRFACPRGVTSQKNSVYNTLNSFVVLTVLTLYFLRMRGGV